jgi:prefoldin subunit 5
MLYDEARIQALENEVFNLRQENARLLKKLSKFDRTMDVLSTINNKFTNQIRYHIDNINVTK